MRVVFDTNILVSALAVPGGAAEIALNRIVAGPHQLIVSKALIDELLDVLARKFARDSEQLARTAIFLHDLAKMTPPGPRLHVLRDDPDNRILECAIAGNASLIVTGDRAMLRLGSFRAIRIISLRSYLDDL